MQKILTDVDVIIIIARRLEGDSWPAIGHHYGYVSQQMRRIIKKKLFPTRKKR